MTFKELRKEKGFTLNELSEKSGVSTVQLSKLENGKSPKPQMATINKLANALNVDFSVIYNLFY